MSTALQICANAYRQANQDQTLSSFSTSQEFPYNIAMDLLNEVVAELNRYGDLWFMQTETDLTYGSGVYAWDLSTINVDPRRVFRVRITANNQYGEIYPVNWRTFEQLYRRAASVTTAVPTKYAIFNDTLETNTIQDQDYGLKVQHFKDIPPVTATSDTFNIPEADEDVLRQGVYALLIQRVGRPDFATAWQMFQNTAGKMRADVKKSSSLPSVMPAAF